MRVLIVGAHPDDETFGMGGTLARHIAEGDEVSVLILTDGVTARGGNISYQHQAFVGAMLSYGVKSFNHLEYKDQQLDAVPLLELVKDIEVYIRRFQPDTVYTHARTDVGQDHRRTLEAVLVAARPAAVKNIISFPCPSSSFWGVEPFHPNLYNDVTGHLDKAIEIIETCYRHESPEYPHPRSVVAIKQRAYWLANLVGKPGQFEEFEVIRSVE